MEIDGSAKRILIVEDEPLLAIHLEDLLTDLGHRVIAIATRIDRALVLPRESEIDIAILDVNVAGSQSFGTADVLRERGIPFVFATGYGAEGLVEGYRQEPILQKPYEPDELERAIALAFRSVRPLPL